MGARTGRPSPRGFRVVVLAGAALALVGCGNAAGPSSRPVAENVAPPIVDEPEGLRPEGMVWVPGGAFRMGSDEGFPDERPVHEVVVGGFWMDATEVTVADFARFVEATGYVTIAERAPRREDFAGQVDEAVLAAIPDEDLVPGSICFDEAFDRAHFPRNRRPMPNEITRVWKWQHGADWRHPEGPGSDIAGRMDHPVTHVAWFDCVAYCEWAGRRLPSEAEWERAARGGLDQARFPWGNEREPGGRWMTNIWQGPWPFENLVQDGFPGTSPVASFPANAYGLFDMAGNVWEWCGDWYRPDTYLHAPRRDPTGPTAALDPDEPGAPKRVQRGGSFMCNENYCTGYRTSARMKGEVSTSSWHCGFRTVVTPAMLRDPGVGSAPRDGPAAGRSPAPGS